MSSFLAYVAMERAEKGNPARVQCVFERAVTPCCLVPELWVEYGDYLVPRYAH